jgi:hypothetical protein
MFIIVVLFYIAEGTMDSSFLTGVHISLGLVSLGFFIKLLIQFGLSNDPKRLIALLVGLCTTTYFIGQALTDLSLLSPWDWMRWRTLPLIAGSLSLLLQTLMIGGGLNLFQQKVISRIPIMVALLCFAFFNQYADLLALIFVFSGGAFLIVSVRKSRYQKRTYSKICLILLMYLGFAYSGQYVLFVVGELLLLAFLFYLFLLQHTFGISTLINEINPRSQEQ